VVRRLIYLEWVEALRGLIEAESRNVDEILAAVQWYSQAEQRYPLSGDRATLTRYEIIAVLYSILNLDAHELVSCASDILSRHKPLEVFRCMVVSPDLLIQTLLVVTNRSGGANERRRSSSATATDTRTFPQLEPDHDAIAKFLELWEALPCIHSRSDVHQSLVRALMRSVQTRTEAYTSLMRLVMGTFTRGVPNELNFQGKISIYLSVIEGSLEEFPIPPPLSDLFCIQFVEISAIVDAEENESSLFCANVSKSSRTVQQLLANRSFEPAARASDLALQAGRRTSLPFSPPPSNQPDEASRTPSPPLMGTDPSPVMNPNTSLTGLSVTASLFRLVPPYFASGQSQSNFPLNVKGALPVSHSRPSTSASRSAASLGGLSPNQASKPESPKPMTNKYNAEEFDSGVEADTVVASVDEVWLQVDPVLNRLIYHNADHDEIMEEIFTSMAPGRFQLLGNRLTWQIDMVAIKAAIGRGGRRNTGSLIDLATSQRDLSSQNTQQSLPEASLSLKYVEVFQFTWGRVANTTAYYVSVHAKQVMKFFPFYDGEINELVAAISDLTGKEPFVEEVYIEEILHQKLEATRMHVLRELTSNNCSWITHTQDLFDVIKNLTQEEKPQSIYDMERLFHSCRLNKEVTRETVACLKRLWVETMSEQVRVKILSVCERLLDRVVMHASDTNFKTLIAWFTHIEGLMDPYRSPQSLKMLLLLRKNADDIKRQPLITLTENQISEQFDYLNEFRLFRSQFSTLDDENMLSFHRTSIL